jgi:hypothetical protein
VGLPPIADVKRWLSDARFVPVARQTKDEQRIAAVGLNTRCATSAGADGKLEQSSVIARSTHAHRRSLFLGSGKRIVHYRRGTSGTRQYEQNYALNERRKAHANNCEHPCHCRHPIQSSSGTICVITIELPLVQGIRRHLADAENGRQPAGAVSTLRRRPCRP